MSLKHNIISMETDDVQLSSEDLSDAGSEEHTTGIQALHTYAREQGGTVENTEVVETTEEKLMSATQNASKPSVILFKWGSPVKPFRCHLCDMTFASSDFLQEHMLKHGPRPNDPKKPFSCTLCLKNYQSKRSLERHQLKHTGHLQIRCKFCSKLFASKDNRDRHILTAHSGATFHQCPYCYEHFSTNINLEHHIATHLGLKEHVCNICSKAFTRKDILERHLLTHEKDKEKRHKCVECGKKFQFLFTLKKHVRNLHCNEPDGKQCEVCGTFIKNRENFGRHMLTHSGERNYVCSVCSKRFSQKQHLKDHMIIHSGIYNLKCEMCHAAFRHRRSLNRHRNKHYTVDSSGKLQCTICPMQTETRQDMGYHYKKLHGLQYECQVCLESFTEPDKLLKHMTEVHGYTSNSKECVNKTTQVTIEELAKEKNKQIDLASGGLNTDTVGSDLHGEIGANEMKADEDIQPRNENVVIRVGSKVISDVSGNTEKSCTTIQPSFTTSSSESTRKVIYVVVPSGFDLKSMEFSVQSNSVDSLKCSNNTSNTHDSQTGANIGYLQSLTQSAEMNPNITNYQSLHGQSNTQLPFHTESTIETGENTDLSDPEIGEIYQEETEENNFELTDEKIHSPENVADTELVEETLIGNQDPNLDKRKLLDSLIDYAVKLQDIEVSDTDSS